MFWIFLAVVVGVGLGLAYWYDRRHNTGAVDVQRRREELISWDERVAEAKVLNQNLQNRGGGGISSPNE
jgi:hypothetical protein